MHWHFCLGFSWWFLLFYSRRDLVLRKWLYLPAPQTAMTLFLIQEDVTGTINSSERLSPKPFTASIWLTCVVCRVRTLGTFAYSRKQMITSGFLFCFPYFFSEAANSNGLAGNSQERDDHEYYNEIPGKEPPTGGVLDMRVQVQTDQRANCLLQCRKQCCLVSTSSSGITGFGTLWEWITKCCCGVKHGIEIWTSSWLS